MTALSFDITQAQGDFTLNARYAGDMSGVTALFGASGAGKSSLLRALAGFEKSASGKVVLAGETLLDSATGRFVKPSKRGFGMVFQQPNLFDHLDVAGNLRFAERRAEGLPGPKYDAVVEALDLGPLLAQRSQTLSGGERQRVAIGRALLARPRMLLMDEPLSGLDSKRKAQILPYIARLPQQFALPVVYVTHAVDELTRIADKMIAMDAGRVVACGDLPEVFPRLDLDAGGSHFEAGAILQGHINGHDPDLHLSFVTVEGMRLSMPSAPLEVGAPVQLRVRARDVMISKGRPEGLSAQNVLPVTIANIIEEPDTAFAELFLKAETQILRARITRAALAQLGLARGQKAFAVLKAISFDKRGF